MAKKPTYEQLEQRIKELEKKVSKGIQTENALIEEGLLHKEQEFIQARLEHHVIQRSGKKVRNG